MAPQRGALIAGFLLASLIVESHAALAQPSPEDPPLTFSRVDSLGLPAAEALHLQQDLETRDYIAAEKILLPEINRDPHTLHAAALLDFMGGVYFLDHDYLHAAIAWSKSQAITPLQPSLRFSLAMTYIRMGHPDWARKALQALSQEFPQNALYPYWLGRIDFDSRSFSDAIQHFQKAIALDPRMARAYDNLGLCYYHQNRNTDAVKAFQTAIDLDRSAPNPSPWPYLNLGITLQLMDRPAEAAANLREAIRLDPKLAQAYFQLGNVLEQTNQLQSARAQFRLAAQIDPDYAEPHFALARIYRKLGQNAAARAEVQTYLRLRGGASSTAAATQPNH